VDDGVVRLALVASRATATMPATTRTATTGIQRFRLPAAGLLVCAVAWLLRFLLLLFAIANSYLSRG